MAMCFRDETFNSLDLVAIGPVCRVRKIFTMRGALGQSTGLDVDIGVGRGEYSFERAIETVSEHPESTYTRVCPCGSILSISRK